MNSSESRLPSGDRAVWNIPNALCLIRITGAGVLIALAAVGLTIWFVFLYVILGITDLIDGPLARRLKQESMAGAKLDSIADILLTAALLTGICILKWDSINGELSWLVLPAASYTLALLVSLIKFGRFPALHTLAAKVNHFLVAVAGICLLMDVSAIPLRVVCVTTLLANIEIVAILLSLKEWRTDVISYFRVRA